MKKYGLYIFTFYIIMKLEVNEKLRNCKNMFHYEVLDPIYYNNIINEL